MVLDYSGRKPVSKNRPRKQPGGVFVLLLVGALLTTFALGVGTGWFISRHAQRTSTAKAAAADVRQKTAEASLPAQGQPGAGGAGKLQEPSLTFYETLPRGSKAVIGSGLNPKMQENIDPHRHPAPPVAPQPPPQPQKGVTPAEAARPDAPEKGRTKTGEGTQAAGAQPEQKDAAAKPAAGKGKFCVQVASYRERKDAEAVKESMTAKGLAAYVIESRVADKGTWYRLKVGRNLDQQTANDLAARVGKGAIVIPE